MPDRCPKCGRLVYRGTVRQVLVDECAAEDGISCRTYLRGVDVGRQLVAGADQPEAPSFFRGFENGTAKATAGEGGSDG